MFWYKNLNFVIRIGIACLICMTGLPLSQCQCLEPECITNSNSQMTEDMHNLKENKKKESIIMPILELKSPLNAKLSHDLSELAESLNLKNNADLKSESKANIYLPLIEGITNNNKANWIQAYKLSRLLDRKRAEGNRNFQTQGWK